MCGFYTIISKPKKFKFNEILINKYLNHRGPDSQKKFSHSGKINFLTKFYRLSIIDRSNKSDQPFKFKNLIISFNGEIYNYLEIKEYLKKKFNAKFKTSGDTEVLIQFLYYEGIKNIHKLEGMWSFILFNIASEKTIICRDRFGEKNLYYFKDKKEIHFCSEIAALIKNLKLKEFNLDYISKYLFCSYRYLFSKNQTLYKNIKFVEPGTYIIVDKNQKLKKFNYFKKLDDSNKKNFSRNKIIKNIRQLLTNTVSKSMRSDVKLAFCLSGGVDSSGLAAIAKKKLNKNIKTYTIFSDDKKYNEFNSVKKTIKNLKIKNHQWIHLDKKNTLSNLKLILKKRLVPLPTFTSYIQWHLMKRISQDGYKVVISGNGSDEIFSGYYDHYLCYFSDVKSIKTKNKEIKSWEKNILPLIRNKDFRNSSYFKKNKYPNYLNSFENDLAKKIMIKKINFIKFKEKKFSKSILKNRMKNETFRESLPVILNEEDLNSMFFSIENRSPYLNNNLYKFMEKIKVEKFINNGYAKSLLRDSLKNIAPNHIINNYEKIGFNIAIDEIINFNSNKIRHFLLTKSKIYKYINYSMILEIFNDKRNIEKYKNFLFKLLNLKIVIDNI